MRSKGARVGEFVGALVRRCAGALVRLYPRRWRERYGEELLALIEDSGAFGPAMLFDLLCGCVRAWAATTWAGLSPKARCEWLKCAAALGAATVGNALSATLATALPSAPRLGHWISDWSRLAVLVVVLGLCYRMTRVHDSRRRLTDVMIVFAIVVANGAILRAFGTWNSPSSLAAFRAGHETLAGYLFNGAGSAVAGFYLIGIRLAPMLWPRPFDAGIDDGGSRGALT